MALITEPLLPRPATDRASASAAERVSRAAALRLPLLVVLLLASWFAHWNTFALPELGLDGALSVDLARSPLREMLVFSARDVHPPLYYAALKGWLGLAGAHYLTAKFLPIATSMLVLALLYALGRRLTTPGTALCAAVILALSPSYLLQAPTVRDFTSGLALSLATLLLTARLLSPPGQDPPSTGGLAVLATLTAAALLTWYFHLFVLATEALLLVSRVLYRRSLLALAAGTVAAAPWYAFVAAPVVGKLGQGTTTFGSAPRLPSPATLIDALAKATSGWPLAHRGGVALAGWLLALLLGAGVVAASGRQGSSGQAWRFRAGTALLPVRRASAELLLLGLLLGVAEVAAVTLRWTEPGALDRYLLPLLPFIVLLQASALSSPRRGLSVASAAGLLVAIIVQLQWFHALATGAPIDWSNDPARAYIRQHALPGDAVLFADRARRARYLLDGGTLPTVVIHTAGQPYLADSNAEANQVASALVGSNSRLWYLQDAQQTPPAQAAQRAVASRAFLAWQQAFGGDQLQLYLTRPPSEPHPVQKTLGSTIALDSASFTSKSAPGGTILVELIWRDLHPTPSSYAVFIHLDDAGNKTVAQHDGPPQLGLRPTNTWQPGDTVDDRSSLALPANLPEGDYHLNAGLYLGQQRLTLSDGTNAIELGTVRIGP